MQKRQIAVAAIFFWSLTVSGYCLVRGLHESAPAQRRIVTVSQPVAQQLLERCEDDNGVPIADGLRSCE